MFIKKDSLKSIHYLWVMTIISLLFASIYNFAFWQDVYEIFSSNDNIPLLFKILAPIAIILLLSAILTIFFSYKYILKPVFIILFITSSLASYATINYGIFFDRAMMLNILQTNVHEAGSYFSLKLLLYFVFLGLLPSFILFKIKIRYPKLIKSFIQRIIYIFVLLAITLAIVMSYYKEFSFIGRINNQIQKSIVPVAYIYSTYTYVRDTVFSTPAPYVAMGKNLKYENTSSKKKLYFLVLGETARVQNYSYYGYDRDTNKYTRNFNTINFSTVKSCGTATAQSVPCMFSNLTKEHFSQKAVENRENIIDIIKKAGFDVTWVENDGGCKGVCQRVKTIEIDPKESKKYCSQGTCHDEIMLKYAQELSDNIKNDTFVAFHIIGSHGPKYFERYPKEFEVYTPNCSRADVESCTKEQIVNSYDNTILYTDYVISKLIEILNNKPQYTTALLYVSDHGESLGENGLYLHGTPYSIAPDEQTHVPMQIWLNQASAKELNISIDKLKAKEHNNYSHDNLFHTLMGLTQIRSDEYNPKLDIINN